MRIPPLLRPTVLATVLSGLAAALIAAEPAWRDATRDVYVDGELDRAAQVFVHGGTHRVALVCPRAEDAFVLDRETGSVDAVPRRAFHLAADRATAERDPADPVKPVGRFQKVDAVAMTFAAGGHVYLVTRHQGATGEIDEAKLFETVPVWKGLMDAYVPDAAVVEALRKVDRPATVTLVFGTWCGDSKEFVPHLLKALHAAANPKLTARLVALDNDFRRPAEVIQGRRILNVPTILVDGPGGGEIGRYVETPAGDSVEADVVAILSGKPRPHDGRYERGPEIARGTYLYRDAAGAEKGTESWTLYERPEGGRLVHSRIQAGELETDVFEGTTAEGRLAFAEITRKQGEGVMRARFSVDGDTLTGNLRGREAGILKQDLVVPSSFSFSSPAIAAAGLTGEATLSPDGAADIVCYVAPETFEAPLGSTCVVTFRAGASESVTVPAGKFRATRVARQTPREISDWWFHPELGIPVRGQVLGGMEYVLASLSVKGS